MINIKEDARLNPLNHSCAHLLAQAVCNLYPQTKLWVGPVIEEGFYYDMDLGDASISEDDFVKIEKEMKRLMKDLQKNSWSRSNQTRSPSKISLNNPYKTYLLNRFSQEDTKITLFSIGDFTDLCRRPC